MLSMLSPSRYQDGIGRLDTVDIVWYRFKILRHEHCYLLPYTSDPPVPIVSGQAGLDQGFPYSYLDFIYFYQRNKNLIIKKLIMINVFFYLQIKR